MTTTHFLRDYIKCSSALPSVSWDQATSSKKLSLPDLRMYKWIVRCRIHCDALSVCLSASGKAVAKRSQILTTSYRGERLPDDFCNHIRTICPHVPESVFFGVPTCRARLSHSRAYCNRLEEECREFKTETIHMFRTGSEALVYRHIAGYIYTGDINISYVKT
jgi:hypothetical protein